MGNSTAKKIEDIIMVTTKSNKKSKEPFLKNFFIFVLLLTFIAFVSAVLYINKKGIDVSKMSFDDIIRAVSNKEYILESNPGEVKSIYYDENKIQVIDSHKGSIITVSRNAVNSIDEKGKTIWEKEVELQKEPFIKSKGEKILVADISGKNIYVIEKGRMKWENSFENNIISVDINEKGYVSVIVDEKGSNGVLYVYDSMGIEIMRIKRGEYNLVSSVVSGRGESVIFSIVDVSGIVPKSTIEVLSSKGIKVSSIMIEDVIISHLEQMDNKMVFAIGNSTVLLIDNNGKELWKKNYKDSYILGISVLDGKYPVIALETIEKDFFMKKKYSVLVFNHRGNIIDEVVLEDKINSFDASENIIAINTNEQIIIFNTKENSTKKFENCNVKKVLVLNKSKVAYIEKNKINIMDIK
mgnify:CR=1 FL=1